MPDSPPFQSILTGLPGEPGTYALLLGLSAARELVIGALGRRVLSPGAYIYVGSALGAGGLRARIAHHARIARRPRWHLDYVRPYTDLHTLWFSVDAQRLEHVWARTILALDGATVPVAGFGASDWPGGQPLFSLRHHARAYPVHRTPGSGIPTRSRAEMHTVTCSPRKGFLQPLGHLEIVN